MAIRSTRAQMYIFKKLVSLIILRVIRCKLVVIAII